MEILRDMPRMELIHELAKYVPHEIYKRPDFMQQETADLRELLEYYINLKKTKMPKNIVMKFEGFKK